MDLSKQIQKSAFYSKNCGLPFLTDRSGSNAQSGLFLSVKTNPNVYLSGREITPVLPARSGIQATSQTGYGIPGSRHSRRSDHGPCTWNPTFLRQLMCSLQRSFCAVFKSLLNRWDGTILSILLHLVQQVIKGVVAFIRTGVPLHLGVLGQGSACFRIWRKPTDLKGDSVLSDSGFQEYDNCSRHVHAQVRKQGFSISF